MATRPPNPARAILSAVFIAVTCGAA